MIMRKNEKRLNEVYNILKEINMYCKYCKQEKDESEFPIVPGFNGSNYRSKRCNTCREEFLSIKKSKKNKANRNSLLREASRKTENNNEEKPKIRKISILEENKKLKKENDILRKKVNSKNTKTEYNRKEAYPIHYNKIKSGNWKINLEMPNSKNYKYICTLPGAIPERKIIKICIGLKKLCTAGRAEINGRSK
jgi:hypothetical protein